MKKPFLLSLLLAIAVFSSAPAYACSCAEPPPPAEAFEASSGVFAGTVVSIDPLPELPGNVRVTVAVNRVWKGRVAPAESILTVATDNLCGYPFVAGVEYLVYSRIHTFDCCGPQFTANLCDRTRPVSQAKEDLVYLGDPRPLDAVESSWGRVRSLF